MLRFKEGSRELSFLESLSLLRGEGEDMAALA
jgi:hypothetical protein